MRISIILLIISQAGILYAQPAMSRLLFNLFTHEKKQIYINNNILHNNYKIKIYTIENAKNKTKYVVYNNWQTWPPCTDLQKSDHLCCTGGIDFMFIPDFRIVVKNLTDSMVLNIHNLPLNEPQIFMDSIIYTKGDYTLNFTIMKDSRNSKKDSLVVKAIYGSGLYISNPAKELKDSRKYKKKKY